MKSCENEKNMPFEEIEKEDGTVHHLKCQGSRRHVSYYDNNGEHCGEPRCELNKPKPKISIGTIGYTWQ